MCLAKEIYVFLIMPKFMNCLLFTAQPELLVFCRKGKNNNTGAKGRDDGAEWHLLR